jgi:hypothetical protein
MRCVVQLVVRSSSHEVMLALQQQPEAWVQDISQVRQAGRQDLAAAAAAAAAATSCGAIGNGIDITDIAAAMRLHRDPTHHPSDGHAGVSLSGPMCEMGHTSPPPPCCIPLRAHCAVVCLAA